MWYTLAEHLPTEYEDVLVYDTDGEFRLLYRDGQQFADSCSIFEFKNIVAWQELVAPVLEDESEEDFDSISEED